MRLKLIVTVNFQRTEAENFHAAMKRNPGLELGPQDVVCMVSLSRQQIVFMYRKETIDVSGYGLRKGTADVFHSERLRLSRSTFEPKMIQNYANQIGIVLDGFRRFEDIYASLGEKENVVDINRARKAKGEKKAHAPRKLMAV